MHQSYCMQYLLGASRRTLRSEGLVVSILVMDLPI